METEVDAFLETVLRAVELVFSEELKSLLSRDMLVDALFAVSKAVDAFVDTTFVWLEAENV